jgi:hypothetical protein
MQDMTPLDKSLKRALKINGLDYSITLTPDALKITQKGHRLGLELKWLDLVTGESALAVALHASIGKFQDGLQPISHKPKGIPKGVPPRHAKTKATPSIARPATSKGGVRKRLR